MFLEQQIMSRQSCFSLSRYLSIRSKIIGLDLPKPRTSIKEEKNSYDIMQSLYDKMEIHRAISETLTFRVGCFLGSGAMWDTEEQDARGKSQLSHSLVLGRNLVSTSPQSQTAPNVS